MRCGTLCSPLSLRGLVAFDAPRTANSCGTKLLVNRRATGPTRRDPTLAETLHRVTVACLPCASGWSVGCAPGDRIGIDPLRRRQVALRCEPIQVDLSCSQAAGYRSSGLNHQPECPSQ